MSSISDDMDKLNHLEVLNSIYSIDRDCLQHPKRLFAYYCDICINCREELLISKEVILSDISKNLVVMKDSGSIDFQQLYVERRITKDNQSQYADFVKAVCVILGCQDAYVYPEINHESRADTGPPAKISLDKDDGEKSSEEYYNLACSLKTPRGIEDTELYIFYLRKACDLGHRLSMHSMARFLYKGKYVDKDVNAAIDLLVKCVDLGEKECLYEIAQLYLKERNDQENYLLYLKEAVASDVKDAKYDLAMLYYNNGSSDDYVNAVKILKSSVEDGDINSMYQLALCYRFGHGVEKNMKEAMELLKKAANMGHSKAREVVGG